MNTKQTKWSRTIIRRVQTTFPFRSSRKQNSKTCHSKMFVKDFMFAVVNAKKIPHKGYHEMQFYLMNIISIRYRYGCYLDSQGNNESY